MTIGPGSVVWKRENAGFVGERLLCRIMSAELNPETPCFLCDNPECLEFANLEVLDPDTHEVLGECYHVSLCQMELDLNS